MRTERIFDSDVRCAAFEARVLERRDVEGRPGVVLDRTCFYPASGGQPCDTGFLGDVRVSRVIEEGEAVVHVLESADLAGIVKGRIDWERRFDHMQQHTGQHILSQAFVQAADAHTVAFHLGEDSGTIDLNRVVDDASVTRAEIIANRAVWEDRKVITRFLPREEAGRLPFRRPPQGEGDVRMVEVEGYDVAGCCGTHVGSTGEVGQVKVSRWEKYKGGSRITFLCGQRALMDYQRKAHVLREVSRRLTVGEEDVPESIRRLEEEKKALSKQAREFQERALASEAGQLLGSAAMEGETRIVRIHVADREMEEVKSLLKKLIRRENVVGLFGVAGERGALLLGRSEDVDLDLRSVLDHACSVCGGRGGGSPSFAQASFPAAENAESALDAAYDKALEMLR